ncbi:MAG TPA: ATPase, T2SS/T4P/T4SS family [Tepidisphaeraceae bacterium]
MEDPYLEIHEDGKVRVMVLGPDPLTIGRHGDNRLVLSDTMSSRYHCHISRSPNGVVMLRDLNSSNGTAVNGHLITYTRLKTGDTITIGKVRMVFTDPNASAAGPSDGDVEIVELGRPNPAAPLAARAAQRQPKAAPPASVQAADNLLDPMPLATDEPEALTDDDIVEDDEPIPVAAADDEPVDVSMYEVPEDAPSGDFGALHELARANDQIRDDDVIPTDDLGLLPDVAAAGDAKQQVEALVNSLPNQLFGENDIALFSARGKLVHAAGVANVKDSYEAVGWLRLLLLLCCRSRATDMHFEPKGSDYLLRMRVDGTMVEVCRLSNALGIRLSALVKVLSEIDIAQKNSIQEGHFSAQVPRMRRADSPRIDYRVSFAPSVYGQKLVIRVLDTAYAPLHVRNLQLPDWMCDEVERVIRQDSGMVLVCGPTGSGKTTTLYALIRGSGVNERNVVTIEDPVEIQLDGVTQIPVDDTHEKSFSDLLRSTLRQDPDVILIGEIRDADTARVAMQAAITGHLVFSTVHAQNTTGTVFRLLDLGAEPYLVSQALHLVLAQRLVRQLCPACKSPVRPTPEQLKKMGPAAQGVMKLYEPRGCAQCLNTGFAGRQAIFELLRVTDELRDLITKTPTASQIYQALSNTPFKRLHVSGYELVAKGIASFSEVERVVGDGR